MLRKPFDWSVALLSLVFVACADPGADNCVEATDCESPDDGVAEQAQVSQPQPGDSFVMYTVASGGHIRAESTNAMICTESNDSRFPGLERSECYVPPGTTLTLFAEEHERSRFVQWLCKDSQSYSNPLVLADIPESTAYSCAAIFEPIRKPGTVDAVLVTGTAGDGGSVALSTTRGDCTASQCQIVPGANVTLKATADTGAFFAGWSGCSTSFASSITLSGVRSDQACTANFIRFF